MTFRVLVADKLPSEGLQAFRRFDSVSVDVDATITPDDLVGRIADYDALVVRSRTTVTADVIAAGTRLRVVGRAGIGVDNIDVDAATRAGVVVMNTPEGNATTTAEHTLSLIFSMARRIPQATASMKGGKWEKNRFTGVELRGKTLGVIGLGNIGRIVAERAQGLRMKVVGYDPFFDAGAAAKLGIDLLPLADLLRRADILTVHTPLNDDTRGLIGDRELEMMKTGVMLVNCARGGIYDEAALLRGVRAGKIGALALDVFVEEPPGLIDLIREDNVICTPHLGASTEEAQVQVAVEIAEQIGAFAAGEPAKNAVNLPRVSSSELRVLGPYLALADAMGNFLGQLAEWPLRRIQLEVAGEIAGHAIEPVGSAAVAGVLMHAFDRPVNAVNARFLAQERGIKVSESRSSTTGSAYASSLTLRVQGARGTEHAVVGVLFEGGAGRFVEVDGIRLEAVPSGSVLVIRNRDEPGVIGHIGTILGAAGINISRMQLGLEGGEALSLINVDAVVPADAIARLGEKVLWVKQVHL